MPRLSAGGQQSGKISMNERVARDGADMASHGPPEPESVEELLLIREEWLEHDRANVPKGGSCPLP